MLSDGIASIFLQKKCLVPFSAAELNNFVFITMLSSRKCVQFTISHQIVKGAVVCEG